MMKTTKSKNLKDLMVRLSRDPQVSAAIDQLRAQSSSQNVYLATSGLDLFVYLLKRSGRFLGAKRARAFAEILEILTFVISVSLILKKNLFDRPEVKKYFQETWHDISDFVGQLVSASSRKINQLLKKSPEKKQSKSSRRRRRPLELKDPK